MISPAGFLMIEPSKPASAEPLIDEVTRKVVAIWRRKTWTSGTIRCRGWHTCSCGAHSDNGMHRLGDVKGPETNSLMVHYVAYHRDEVPAADLVVIEECSITGEAPSEKELKGTKPVQGDVSGFRGHTRSHP